MKTVVILQSSYIPWKGYFDLMSQCDEFVIFDSVQFTKRDWRSRNKIKTANGPQWLTVPVESKGKFEQPISEVRIAEPGWAEKHWQTLRHAYAKAPHFRAQEGWIKKLYEDAGREPLLGGVNLIFLRAIGQFLGIRTPLVPDAQYPSGKHKTERLVEICKQAGATTYVSGPAAKAYMENSLFEAEGIALRYFDYGPYPEYPQLHGAFMHDVSILDAIFNLGPDARAVMKPFAATARPSASQ